MDEVRVWLRRGWEWLKGHKVIGGLGLLMSACVLCAGVTVLFSDTDATSTPEPTRVMVVRVTATASVTATCSPMAPSPTPPPPTETTTGTATMAPSRTRAPTASATSSADAVVAADTLNLREGPGTTYAVISSLKKGDRLRIVGRNSDESWIQVKAGAWTGWVSAELCEVTKDLTWVPVVDVGPVTAVIRVTSTPRPAAAATWTPVPPTAVPAAVCDCSGPDLDCGDFHPRSSAQRCFDYCLSQGFGDVFGLDGDGDGRVCE